MNDSPPLLQAHGITKCYKSGKNELVALNKVSIAIDRGETLGLVGESGCGKSTLGKVILGLEKANVGQLFFSGKEITQLGSKERRALCRSMQMVFQNPYASLNPRMTVEDIVAEGLDIHQIANHLKRRDKVSAALCDVGLDESVLDKYPHEFSGGQRQRIGLARALVVDPEFIVCDEPTSALDACTKKNIMDLLLKHKQKQRLAYLFISHDLNAVRTISDRVAVMYLGELIEIGNKNDLFSTPLHPYTQALLSSIPCADPIKEKKRVRIALKGELPSSHSLEMGCRFKKRCPYAMPICMTSAPHLLEIGNGHFASCHRLTVK